MHEPPFPLRARSSRYVQACSCRSPLGKPPRLRPLLAHLRCRPPCDVDIWIRDYTKGHMVAVSNCSILPSPQAFSRNPVHENAAVLHFFMPLADADYPMIQDHCFKTATALEFAGLTRVSAGLNWGGCWHVCCSGSVVKRILGEEETMTKL